MEQIRITLTVPDGTREELAKAAQDTNRSRANLVALLLGDYLKIREGGWEGDDS